MDTNEIKIRPATEADAAEILNIYAPYITDTAITFEYDVPTLEEFTGRIRHTLEKYPYLVAVRDSEIIGYAYAGAFYGRAAYDWSAETTIYNHTSGILRSNGIPDVHGTACCSLSDIHRLLPDIQCMHID